MGIMAGIKSLMGFGGVSETISGIVKKIAGTELPPDQAMELVTKYHQVTKHQSPARRFIAVTVTLMWALLGAAWLTSAIISRVFYDVAYSDDGAEIANQMTLLAGDVSTFMSDNVSTHFTVIVMFYFTVQLVNGIKN